MTETVQKNLYLSIEAKGRAAALREIVRKCDDREVGQELYRDLLRIAGDLSNKFGLGHKSKGEEKREAERNKVR